MTAATAQPSAISKILAGLNDTFSDPSSAGLTGFAQGLLQASAPHMLTPVSGGQALGMGEAASQQYQNQAMQNAMLRQTVPFQAMRVQSFLKAFQTMQDPKASPSDKAAAKAFVYSMAGAPALGNSVYTNAPPVVAGRTKAESLNKPVTVGPSARVFGPTGSPSVGAQGPLPEASFQNLGSLDLNLMPGAPQVVTANAFNRAGGSAAGSYPVNAALAYHTRAPGAAGGTLGPPPAPFAPMGGAPPASGGGVPPTSPGAPTPAAIAAAQAAARQRQIGTMQGITSAAHAAGQPAPVPPLPPMPGTNPNTTPPGSRAAAAEVFKTPQGRAQVAARLHAAIAQQAGAPQAATPQQPGGRPILALRPPQPTGTGNGLMSPGLSPAQVELQKQAAQQTGAAEAEGNKETEAANAQLSRLTEMQNALTQIPVGGNIAKIYAGVGDVLNYAGVKIPGLTAIQEYTKYRTNFVADAARKMGSRISYQEVSYIAKGVPDFTLAGNAPKALLAQLSGAVQYDIARNQAMQYYETKVPNLYGKAYRGTSRGFEQWWQKTGVTPGAFMFMNTLFSLPPGDRGQYLQNFRSTTTGKVYMQQYAKAQAFLRSNPGLVPFWSAQQ